MGPVYQTGPNQLSLSIVVVFARRTRPTLVYIGVTIFDPAGDIGSKNFLRCLEGLEALARTHRVVCGTLIILWLLL